MGGLPYYKRYPRDALHGMLGMSLEERGAYNTLLDMIFDASGPIPDQERLLCGYMNCDIRVWRRIRKTLLDSGKIYLTADGKIGNARADLELTSTEHLREVRRKSAGSSPEVRDSQTIAKSEVLGNANENNGTSEHLLSNCPAIPEPEPEPERKKGDISIAPLFDVPGKHLALVSASPRIPAKEENQDFEIWWKQYPRRVDKGSARKAYERVVKAGKATAEQLTAGAIRYAAERQGEDPKYTKHATTWLNAEAWGNEAIPRVAAGANLNRASQSRADSAIEGIMSYFTEREQR